MAVRLDYDYELIDTFKTYVKPEVGRIEEFCMQLTGITNEMVENAPPLEHALVKFEKWVGTEDTNFYAWSKSDYLQLTNEMTFKNIDNERILNMAEKFIDFQLIFGLAIGIDKNLSLTNALGSANIEFEGNAHDALNDAKNTAALLKLYSSKEEFTRVMNPIKNAFSNKESCFTSLGNLIPEGIVFS